MPIVEVHVLEGYGDEVKSRLGAALTDAVRFVLPAAPDLVTVMIHEMPLNQYYRGGQRRSPAPARPDPAQTVLDFLGAMEKRELEKAQACLDEEFTMQFPGAPAMTKLSELIAWAGPRYRFITKTYDGVDAMQSAGDPAIVYCRGTLSGGWPNGQAFDGIRFIDRFEVINGLITKQDVWNDIAETRPQA